MELAKRMLDEIQEYIDEEPDMARRLKLQAQLERIVFEIRELNLEAVP